MSQVIGQSSEPSQPGILGQNSANGDAVFGDGGSGGRGVVGVSQTHTGVEGTTVSGMAVFGGGGASGRGVVGLADAATAVEGQSKSGAGVWGQSQTGIGVLGKGGRLAGQFLGDVDITGNLIIQGVSIQAWLQRIVALEREVAALRSQLASHSGGGGTTQTPSNKPTINSATNQGSGKFQIKGNGFLKSHAVRIRVTNTATLAGDFFQATSDGSGNLDATLTIPSQASGTVLAFSANDGRPDATDLTGTLWSNTFTITT